MTTRAVRAAEILMQARTGRTRIPVLPPDAMPDDIAEAYAVQPAVRKAISANGGGRQIGWKIGCTNETAQRQIGVHEPFFGGIFENTSKPSPATFSTDDFFMTVIEAEVGFLMGEDLPAAAAPYDPGSVGDAVAAAFPAIEIVDSRFQDWTTIGPLQIIADNGSHGAWVHGAPVSNWQDIDLAELAVNLYADGELVREGQGINVMDHPLNALTWLANVRAVYARDGLKAGDRVSTGTTIVVYDAHKGQHLKADFGPLGSIELTLE
ncbi:MULTISPECIES: fumarylacetoacetate hydrolase family protein [unclassified Minwuia]|jgi:2-keto-4-pentenoate hydratase|uniref:2-keto-4-pentenoate hydratase n=1 Tax=unclassified Minwuia TaxID=2618799 RepID=UPI00247ACF14|nr:MULTISPECIES: fumarylacetoacetate hydrolase family protein [unclassified Minwuia]